MTIKVAGSKVHWTYFLALERDLELASRYVEFSQQNFSTFSIEFAHLLLAAASEVDVVAKLVCAQCDPRARRGNIDDYRGILVNSYPEIVTERVHVPRFGLTFAPWENWAQGINPDWWRSYNNVKHERDIHFAEATLHNTLNSIGALLILGHRYYRSELAGQPGNLLGKKDATEKLKPDSTLLRLDDDFYYEQVYA